MNINNFELYMDETILERGRNYRNSGNILSLEYDGEEWTADVQGSDDYSVIVVLSEDNEILYSECDCPYDWSKHCKHKAAVFYAIRNKIKAGGISVAPVKTNRLKSVIRNLNRQQLMSIILNYASKADNMGDELIQCYAVKEIATKTISAFERRRRIENRVKNSSGDKQLMDWQKNMSEAIDYIENNLSDDIDYSIAAQYMNCSVWEFQRLFSFVVRIPVAEYIRQRRLTLAAQDIQLGNDKVIDVAMQYGYDSPSSFSRAFSQLHGITPRLAKQRGITLAVYPRFVFQTTSKKISPIKYRVVEKKAFQVIGITKRFTMEEGVDNGGIGRLWDYWNYNNLIDKFHGKYGKDEPHDMCVSLPTDKTDEFSYTVGFLYNGEENTDGFDVVNVTGGAYVVFNIPNEYTNDVGTFMGHCLTEYLPDAGYTPMGIDAEYFSDNCKSEAWFLVVSQ